MSDFHPKSEYFRERLVKDPALLEAIKASLPDLERLASPFAVDYEDGIYRLYHHSFKVYQVQNLTNRAVDIFKRIARATGNELCEWFQLIVATGTEQEWDETHNRDWLTHTRPIVEAFLHAKYFLDMMIKYAHELDSPPKIMPFGWAAILELYNQR